ncbi:MULTISPECIES: YbhB/YbcL family Raf kinase inhibitor-like protein [Mesorhizobium]|uniref:YbhB/YbcL family Raf kinase inhibitor-like protein n=1 Tax=Mesorhizobium denitrificans TaxID=2294114 RepID=A0A371XC42_9HYPH|nr:MULTISPECIES: YbhB/YbcL family Raf kinase inhibitor-like protein [Mesorhizobium]RFC66604.1 YbhB/YbcL family Raf kinase inhibitor-like protein [Mesorhizobium denitrificans]
MAYPTVELSSVRKTFGPTVALGGANLTAYAGEVHAIIGGNGSGKSTLAKVISGVLIPDSGQVSILGKSATSPYEARKLGISNVFQEVLVADECSVLDNLYLGADSLTGASMNREDKEAKAGALMRELLGFDVDLSTLVGELPLSIKQWITIARALLTDPKVLILDESSAALDFESTERLFRKMRQLKARGASILIVTHRIAELVRIADRATVLRDGVDVGRLSKSEITEARILELIAGPEREKTLQDQPLPARQSDAALLRVFDAKVWSDSLRFNFTLYPGEVVGVTGLDGQGQADFVRAVAGIQPLEAGEMTVVRDGKATVISDLTSARDNDVSYVSGDRKKEGIFANLSIFENMMMPVYKEYRAGGILNLINRTKLSPVFEWEAGKLAVKMGDRQNLITSLSGGNQQKVLIARSFAEKPVVLVLNDPARGIDIGAKLDLYRNLKVFAARGNAVLFLSSEIEEFLNLCTRVHVFRNGSISADFEPPYDGHVILNAMFGRKATARMPGEPANQNADKTDSAAAASHVPRFEDGRPVPRVVNFQKEREVTEMAATPSFKLHAPDIAPGGIIPARFTEDSKTSPRLIWSGAPEGTRSFALSITDPDLPEAFNFPRSFAHWLVTNIPANIRELPEGASGGQGLPQGAVEFNSDFVTFKIPGFGRGYGGPWPPDREHRYFFTLYALKADRLDLPADADLTAFAAAVMPVSIDAASFVAVYGPAKQSLPG